MMNKKKTLAPLSLVGLAALAVGSSACGSSSTTAEPDTSVTLSGQVSLTGSQARSGVLASSVSSSRLAIESPNSSSAINPADLIMSCLTLGLSPNAGNGAFDSAGKFSVAIPGAAGKKIGCFILKGEEVLATMVFKDSSKKGLDGNDKSSDAQAFTGSADLGSIVVDTDSGKAEVDVANITGGVATSTVAGAEAFDITGAWKITALPDADMSAEEKKQGYSNAVCPAGSHESHGSGPECNGPSEGESLYFKRVAGTYADGSAGYGAMLWESEAAFTACGSKLGNTYAKLNTDTGIDFSASGVSEGEFSFDTTSGGHTLTDGWKFDNATANYDIRDCGPSTTYPGAYECTDTLGNKQINKGGGCTNAAGTPVVMAQADWNSMWAGGGATCTNTTDSDGFNVSTCKRTITLAAGGSAQEITCKNTGKEVLVSGSFQYNDKILAAGGNCSSIAETSDALKIAKLRCYSEFYYQNRPEGGSCTRQIETDWTTNNPADFVKVSYNPESLMMASLLEYDAGGSASISNNSERYRGVEVKTSSGSTYVNCRTIQSESVSITKVSATRLKVKFTQIEKNASLDRPACVAAAAQKSKEGKYIFYFDAQ